MSISISIDLEVVKRLWSVDGYTMLEIADHLGETRSTIAGIISRQGFIAPEFKRRYRTGWRVKNVIREPLEPTKPKRKPGRPLGSQTKPKAAKPSAPPERIFVHVNPPIRVQTLRPRLGNRTKAELYADLRQAVENTAKLPI